MASRLLAAGYLLTVIAHRNRRRIDDLVSKGVCEAAGYAELADASHVIILCVNNSRVVEEVVNTPRPDLCPGMMIIYTGISRPNATRPINRDLSGIEVLFAESPVTGGVEQAADSVSRSPNIPHDSPPVEADPSITLSPNPWISLDAPPTSAQS